MAKWGSMRWQTVLRIIWNADESKAEEYFHYTEEMVKAYKSNNLPKDVTDEIEKLKAADLIIFQAFLFGLLICGIRKNWEFFQLFKYTIQWIMVKLCVHASDHKCSHTDS